MKILSEHLVALYGALAGADVFRRLSASLEYWRPRIPAPHHAGLDERDAILITYGDQVQAPDTPPLRSLADFCARHLTGLIGGIHILPFYPYSSDDGFSIVDYRAVDPALGDWDDIARFGRTFRLMFDAVINHVSAQSEWFKRFVRADPRARDWFIAVPPGADLSRVVRPRTLPLLTRFATAAGEKEVWTTFSADQVDLNYHNPDVLLEIVDTLLFYVAHGAEFIRLDAVAFLWKEYGTTCLNLPQTHRVVRLFRAVLDEVAPHVMLITETNVPHADNLSYFGDGADEAQMVYNFALPPLVLHTFHTGTARALTLWARGLSLPSRRVTFFNFLASHDGIGLNPVRGTLTDAEIDALVTCTLEHGGLVSYKNNPDGTTSPYELNINYYDALNDPQERAPAATPVGRFLAAQAIMLSLLGVPGIYFHSLFGSRGWRAGVAQTGQNRTINREKYAVAALENELADPGSVRHAVLEPYRALLRVRAAHPAFHPHGTMRVLDAGPHLFAILRTAPDAAEEVLCLQNVANRPESMAADIWRSLPAPAVLWHDLLTGRVVRPGEPLELDAYQTLWLVRSDGTM